MNDANFNSNVTLKDREEFQTAQQESTETRKTENQQQETIPTGKSQNEQEKGSDGYLEEQDENPYVLVTANAQFEYMQHLQKIQQLVDNIDQKSKELGQAEVQCQNATSDTPRQHHQSSLISESPSKLKLHRIKRSQERRLEA